MKIHRSLENFLGQWPKKISCFLRVLIVLNQVARNFQKRLKNKEGENHLPQVPKEVELGY